MYVEWRSAVRAETLRAGRAHFLFFPLARACLALVCRPLSDVSEVLCAGIRRASAFYYIFSGAAARRGAAAGVTVTVAVTWPNGRPARQAPPSAKRRQSLSDARIEAPRRGCGDAPNEAADC